jgi:hypothetical protein
MFTGMGRPPKNEFSSLAKSANAQLRRAEMLGKSLDERLKAKRKAADEFTLNEDDRRDFQSITQTIRDCGVALVRALDANKKDLAGLSEDQLTDQFQAELVKAAQEISDDNWARMVAARAKARG